MDGTFILFVYEFDCAEKLHSCTYANSSSRRSLKQQEIDAFGVPMLSNNTKHKLEIYDTMMNGNGKRDRLFMNQFKNRYFGDVYNNGNSANSLDSLCGSSSGLQTNKGDGDDGPMGMDNYGNSTMDNNNYNNLLQFNNAVNFFFYYNVF